MGTSQLAIDVYVAPMRPYVCPDQLGEGEVATWAPSSSTLISGPTEGIHTTQNAPRIRRSSIFFAEDSWRLCG